MELKEYIKKAIKSLEEIKELETIDFDLYVGLNKDGEIHTDDSDDSMNKIHVNLKVSNVKNDKDN